MKKDKKSSKNNDEMTEELVLDELDESEGNPQASLKKLRDKLKACQAERQEYLDGWQRSKADYINLRRAEEKMRLEIAGMAKEDIFHDLLTLADSFEMAFANQESWQQAPENWRLGVEYIYSQLLSTFNNHGLVEIKAEGLPFNPLEHQSIASIEVSEPKEDQLVLEVTKKGYKLGSKVIRPAHVKVGIYQSN
jgi:molecular chaperone GrpE